MLRVCLQPTAPWHYHGLRICTCPMGSGPRVEQICNAQIDNLPLFNASCLSRPAIGCAHISRIHVRLLMSAVQHSDTSRTVFAMVMTINCRLLDAFPCLWHVWVPLTLADRGVTNNLITSNNRRLLAPMKKRAAV